MLCCFLIETPIDFDVNDYFLASEHIRKTAHSNSIFCIALPQSDAHNFHDHIAPKHILGKGQPFWRLLGKIGLRIPDKNASAYWAA